MDNIIAITLIVSSLIFIIGIYKSECRRGEDTTRFLTIVSIIIGLIFWAANGKGADEEYTTVTEEEVELFRMNNGSFLALKCFESKDSELLHVETHTFSSHNEVKKINSGGKVFLVNSSFENDWGIDTSTTKWVIK